MSRKPHKVDVELTASMGYKEPWEPGKKRGSYRTIFGQEFLVGADKTARRWEVYKRHKGRCFGCGRWTSFEDGDWDHVLPLSKGGDDSLENGRWAGKFYVCQCHTLRHGRTVQFGVTH